MKWHQQIITGKNTCSVCRMSYPPAKHGNKKSLINLIINGVFTWNIIRKWGETLHNIAYRRVPNNSTGPFWPVTCRRRTARVQVRTSSNWRNLPGVGMHKLLALPHGTPVESRVLIFFWCSTLFLHIHQNPPISALADIHPTKFGGNHKVGALCHPWSVLALGFNCLHRASCWLFIQQARLPWCKDVQHLYSIIYNL